MYKIIFTKDKRSSSSKLVELVENAKEQGKLRNSLELLTSYSKFIERDKCFEFTILPSIHPLDVEANAIFVGKPWIFKEPISIIANIYTGKSKNKSEFYFIQKRNRKGVNQGQHEIGTASAGFIAYSDTAEETARKETEEEIGIAGRNLIIIKDSNGSNCEGIVMHYIGTDRIRNPCLCFTFFVKSVFYKEKDRRFVKIDRESYPIVTTLHEVDAIMGERNKEVFAACVVPLANLQSFWQQVVETGRDFGPSFEVVNNFLASYMA